jgi:hypothetical protein
MVLILHPKGRMRVMKSFVLAVSMAVVLMASSSALAQGYYANYLPVGPAPVVSYYAPAPVAGYGPVVATSYYAPAPYYAASPVSYYAASPVPYYVAAPVPAGPVAVGPVAVAPVYYGRPAIVHPKVYYPGQPVRNVLRAVTP